MFEEKSQCENFKRCEPDEVMIEETEECFPCESNYICDGSFELVNCADANNKLNA